MAERPREFEKDPVDAFIIIGGCIVGCLLLISFVGFVVSAVDWWNVPHNSQSIQLEQTYIPDTSTICTNCLSAQDNNHTYTVFVGDILTLELPENQYLQSNIFLYDSPSGTIELGAPVNPRSQGNWAISMEVAKPGLSNIVVKGTSSSTPDFNLSFVIQNKS